jgi:hypothetical protein
MSKKEVNPEAKRQLKSFFKQLNLLFGIFLSGVFLVLVSVMVVVYYREPENHDLDTALLIAAPISSAALLVLANRLVGARTKAAAEMSKLYEKMDAYRGAIVLRFLLLDGAIFVQVIAYLFTENKLFIALAVLMITFFMLYKPGVTRFIKDLALSDLEAEVVRDHTS